MLTVCKDLLNPFNPRSPLIHCAKPVILANVFQHGCLKKQADSVVQSCLDSQCCALLIFSGLLEQLVTVLGIIVLAAVMP